MKQASTESSSLLNPPPLTATIATRDMLHVHDNSQLLVDDMNRMTKDGSFSTRRRYNFTTWEQDEGNGICPSCSVRERHDELKQEVIVDISVVE